MNEVKRTERGWAGHYCAADSCKFRRNTLLEYGDTKIIVSTVGCFVDHNGKIQEIGLNRDYETMAFYVDKESKEYNDADVSKPIYFESNWALKWHEGYIDNEANKMHETVVKELTEKLQRGELKEEADMG